MSDALAECIFHARHTICGKRLQPFTLWHAWLLDFCESPFIDTTRPGAAADLALAIEICSQPASSPARCQKINLHPSARLIRQIFDKGFKETAAAFRAYLADHVSLPRCWENGGGRPIRSHIALYSVAVLMRHGRRTEHEAWATEYGYARHLVLALAEAGGNEIPILSAAEEAALKEAGHVL
ncbi:MAG: hypothetical protein ACOYNN_04175 [Terrimicrobiaceae bacterium]